MTENTIFHGTKNLIVNRHVLRNFRQKIKNKNAMKAVALFLISIRAAAGLPFIESDCFGLPSANHLLSNRGVR